MTGMTVCKLKCQSVTTQGETSEEVRLSAEYDPTLPEDKAFNTATPNASMQAWINNPAVIGFFEPGKSYYVELRPAA